MNITPLYSWLVSDINYFVPAFLSFSSKFQFLNIQNKTMLFFLIALIGFIFKNQIRRTLAFAVGWQRKRFFFFSVWPSTLCQIWKMFIPSIVFFCLNFIPLYHHPVNPPFLRFHQAHFGDPSFFTAFASVEIYNIWYYCDTSICYHDIIHFIYYYL